MLPPSLRKNKNGLLVKTLPTSSGQADKQRQPFDKENFFDRVYKVVKKIPRGRVTSYGAIATYLGTSSSARTVGWAMNAAHLLVPPIPAHRVVNRNGLLTGKNHFATPTLMHDLLQAEGVKVKDDKVVDFKKIYWEPKQS